MNHSICVLCLEDPVSFLEEHCIILVSLAVAFIGINGLLVVCIVRCCTQKISDKTNSRNEPLCGQVIDSSKKSPIGKISIVCNSIISPNTTLTIEIN